MTCDIKASSLKLLRPEGMAFFGASTKHDVFRSIGTFSSSRLGGGGGFSTKPIENLLLHIKYAMLDWVAMTITMYIRWYLTVTENQSI